MTKFTIELKGRSQAEIDADVDAMISEIGWTPKDSEARKMRIKRDFQNRDEIEARIEQENDAILGTAELRAALKPFADLAIWIAENRPEHNKTAAEVQIENWPYTLSVGDLQKALELLTVTKCLTGPNT